MIHRGRDVQASDGQSSSDHCVSYLTPGRSTQADNKTCFPSEDSGQIGAES
jgi:hypothetical protein